jgi:thioredoxin-like negative regulator of GroEL
MTIRGDLLSVDLSNVFQMLALNRKRGVLVVQSRENILDKRAMLLEEDHIAVVDVPASSDVTALMVEAGDIDFALWAEARDKAGSYRIGAVDYLVRRRKVDEDAVGRARRRLQEEEILEIFLWNNVTFSLDEEAQPPADPDRAFVVIDQIVMEAARRQDEWRRVVELLGGGGDIFEPVHGAAELVALKEMPPVVRIVFESLNGARATQQLVEATSLPRYFVDSAIFTLLEQGFVRRLELDDLVKRGEECLATGVADDAIRLLKTALRSDRRNIAIHKNLAAAYLLAGKIAKAAQHEKFSGLIQAKAGDFAAATLSFQTAVQHLPTDFKSIERALYALAHRGGHHTEADRATLDQGLRLFSFHFESKRYEPAERVLESLTAILPHDTDLAFALARLLAKMGRIAESVEHYMRIAGRLYELGDLDGALVRSSRSNRRSAKSASRRSIRSWIFKRRSGVGGPRDVRWSASRRCSFSSSSG